jgi:hypothetical protein
MNEEVEVIASEGRRKGWLVGGLGLAALVGLGVYMMLPRGTGNPEEAHRVLIVNENTRGLASYLGDLGFEVVAGTMPAWQDKIVEEMEGPPDAGLEELLAFADRYGYGFVVLENPERFDFSEIDVDAPPELAPHVRFAALSVGDFAFPHEVSVNPEPSEVRTGIGIDLLGALFAQSRLTETIVESEASLDALSVRSKISQAISELEQIEFIEAKAARVEMDLREALQATSDGVELIDDPMEGSSVVPLADGRMLVASQKAHLVSPNGMRLDLRVDRDWAFRAIPPGAQPKADARVDCSELLGGTLAGTERLAFAEAADRRALMIQTVETGPHLWHFDAAAGPCGLVDAGAISIPADPIGYLAVRPGAAAGKILVDDLMTIEVSTLDGATTRLGSVPGGGARSLVWLDERRLAFLLNPIDDVSSVVFVDLDHPDLVLNYPLVEVHQAREILPLPGSDRALVLRVRGRSGDGLVRLDFSRGWEALFTEPPGAEDVPPVEREGLPTIMLLTAEIASTTPIATEGTRIVGFDVAPDGTSLVYTSDSNTGVDVSVAAIPEPGGKPSAAKRLVSDDYENRDAAFTGDGRFVVFTTRHTIDDDAGIAYSARSIDPS